MKTVILDSRNHYMVYNENIGDYEYGDYYTLAEAFPHLQDRIEYDCDGYTTAKDDFLYTLRAFIRRYEHAYNTCVGYYALIGEVGTWQGKTFVGKVYTHHDLCDILVHSGVEHIVVGFSDEGYLEFQLSHHDGTHYMYLYVITQKKFDRLKIRPEYCGTNELEQITKMGNPVFCNKLWKE